MKILLLLPLFALSAGTYAQSNTVLMDFNNVSATVSDAGTLFNDFAIGYAGYEVPKGSGNHALYSLRLGFAGTDINSQIKMAISGYPGLGNDLFRGPIANFSYYGDSNYINRWDTAYFQYCQSELDAYLDWWMCENGIPGPNCATVQAPSQELMYRLNNYPAHGDIANGEAFYLAPFVDFNTDGTYNPADGDIPLIERGCCMTYIILNDAANVHTYSGGDIAQIEVHTIVYQYDVWGGYLDDATFVDVRVINRGTATYYDYKTSLIIDADVGYYGDDFSGSDSTQSMAYFYNADNLDEPGSGIPGYGVNPPSVGIVNLNNMASSIVYLSGGSNVAEIWNLMSGLQASGNPFLDDQGQVTQFSYYDDPNDPTGWSEVTTGNMGGDRRMIMNAETAVLAPGDTMSNSFAIIFAQGSDNLNSVTELLNMASDVHSFFDNESLQACEAGVWGLEQLITDPELRIYPNPSSGKFIIETGDLSGVSHVSILDLSGRTVFSNEFNSNDQIQIELNEQPGVYIIRIVTTSGEFMRKVVLK